MADLRLCNELALRISLSFFERLSQNTVEQHVRCEHSALPDVNQRPQSNRHREHAASLPPIMPLAPFFLTQGDVAGHESMIRAHRGKVNRGLNKSSNIIVAKIVT